jgi:hypothetical protein
MTIIYLFEKFCLVGFVLKIRISWDSVNLFSIMGHSAPVKENYEKNLKIPTFKPQKAAPWGRPCSVLFSFLFN